MWDTAFKFSCDAFVYLMMFIGALGSFLPIIPGPIIAFLALLLYKFAIPESPMGWTFIGICFAITCLAQIVDFVLSWVGAKKFGATWRGCLGAFIGVFVGILIPPQIIWIFIAPLIGAFIGEYLGGADFRSASKAGIGAFIGSILASVFKFACVVAMALGFYIYS